MYVLKPQTIFVLKLREILNENKPKNVFVFFSGHRQLVHARARKPARQHPGGLDLHPARLGPRNETEMNPKVYFSPSFELCTF